MTLFPHQHRALVNALQSETFSILTVDAAFMVVSSVGFLKQIGTVRFMTDSELAKLSEKRRQSLTVVLISDEELAKFPTGVPGFPNKMRREWFNAAWTAARG